MKYKLAKLLAAILAVFSLSSVAIACGHSYSCADELAVVDKGYSPPARSGSSHSGGSSSTKSGPSSKTYTAPPKSQSGGHTAPSKSQAGKPTPPKGLQPPRYSGNGRIGRNYVAPNGHSYVHHVHSFYHSGGYHDLYDPWDPFNYYNPLSPFFQRHIHYTGC